MDGQRATVPFKHILQKWNLFQHFSRVTFSQVCQDDDKRALEKKQENSKTRTRGLFHRPPTMLAAPKALLPTFAPPRCRNLDVLQALAKKFHHLPYTWGWKREAERSPTAHQGSGSQEEDESLSFDLRISGWTTESNPIRHLLADLTHTSAVIHSPSSNRQGQGTKARARTHPGWEKGDVIWCHCSRH